MFNFSKYFPKLTNDQIKDLRNLLPIYQHWNSQINVISRKDMDFFFINHVLHGLSIAKVFEFRSGTAIIDVGTGGGFPGIPLAIMFPEVTFHLIDSIGKKIKVVRAVKEELGLKNVEAYYDRMENFDQKVDFVVSRAVAPMETLMGWVEDKVSIHHKNDIKNGLICLKGGDLTGELNDFPQAKVFSLNNFFGEPFFVTKKIVYLPIGKFFNSQKV